MPPHLKNRWLILLCLVFLFQASAVYAKKSDDGEADPKHAKLNVPPYQPLTVGAGPQTNDSEKSSTVPGATDLSEIKLDGDSQAQSEPIVNSPGENDVDRLNAGVTETKFTPASSVNTADVVVDQGSTSVKPANGEDDAAALGPVQLMQSDDETEKKVETALDMERAELSDLWDATLCRSKDVQFVVDKLAPAKDAHQQNKSLVKSLAGAVYTASDTFASLSGANPGLGNNAGAQLVKKVLVQGQTAAGRKAAVTENEAIQLYSIIRNTAKQLVENYYNYKKYRNALSRANIDSLDLQAMVKEAAAKTDTGKRAEMDYILRKQDREIEALKEDLHNTKLYLVDLAGEQAIAKLDQQIEIENKQIEAETHMSDAKNTVPPAQ